MLGLRHTGGWGPRGAQRLDSQLRAAAAGAQMPACSPKVAAPAPRPQLPQSPAVLSHVQCRSIRNHPRPAA